MTPQALECLMSDIEEADPLDFSDLAINVAAARRLMASHFCELDERLREAGLPAEDRVAMMAAIAAHTMEANFLIHLRQLGTRSGGFDLRLWMQQHGFG